eukprot:6188263-Pleurochrysis_carterae.AAC.1
MREASLSFRREMGNGLSILLAEWSTILFSPLWTSDIRGGCMRDVIGQQERRAAERADTRAAQPPFAWCRSALCSCATPKPRDKEISEQVLGLPAQPGTRRSSRSYLLRFPAGVLISLDVHLSIPACVQQ